MLGTYHLNGLFDILKEIHFIYDPDKLWESVLVRACAVLQCEAGSFYSVSIDGETMAIRAATGADFARLAQVPFRVGSGIAGWVAQYQQPALVTDVRQDNRFNGQADMTTGFKTRSILCVPVFSQNRAYGVMEMMNKKSGLFSPQDQEFMTLLARQTGVAYHNLLLINEVMESKTLLESTVESLSGGLIAIDRAGKITLVNQAAARLLQLPHDQMPGKTLREALSAHPWFVSILEKTQETGEVVSRQEAAVPLEGMEARLGYTTLLIADRKKTILGAGIIFQRLSPQ